MAKLLIVEDHLDMVRLLQVYIEKINSRFTKENTFCFSSKKGPLRIHSLTKLDGEGEKARARMTGKKSDTFLEVFGFLSRHPNEKVLILIDVLLNSQNISAPSFERYRADAEYSCELYAELLRIRNGKKVSTFKNINQNNFVHLIYSRSDASIGVVTAVLDDLFQKQNEEDRRFFPRECTLFENISWCRNCCDTTDQDFGVVVTERDRERPLALPKEYRDYIQTLV